MTEEQLLKVVKIIYKKCKYMQCKECEFKTNNTCPAENAIHELEHVGFRMERHAHWEWFYDRPYDAIWAEDDEFGYRCSNCKSLAEDYGVDGDIYEEPPTRLYYCPNCGAKMEEEPDESENHKNFRDTVQNPLC